MIPPPPVPAQGGFVTRAAIVTLGACVPLFVTAQSAPPPAAAATARTKFDVDRTIGEVEPLWPRDRT
jgi:hypothetical protein